MAKFQYNAPPEDDDPPFDPDNLDVELEVAKLNEAYSDDTEQMLEDAIPDLADFELPHPKADKGKRKAKEPICIDSVEQQPKAGTSVSRPKVNRRAVENGVSNSKLSSLEGELASVRSQIKDLQAVEALLLDDIRAERSRLAAASAPSLSRARTNGVIEAGKGGAIDYTKGDWPWSEEMRATMEKVLGFKTFRLCQEGVCNAVMHDRDVVVLMPTGGGKSACYQLPSLLTPGKTTLVVSPLIALMTDQLLHLQEAGVEAVMINGSTSKEEANEIMSRMVNGGARSAKKGKSKAMAMDVDGKEWTSEEEIKLCYVTPEKLAKSKTFISTLQKMYEGDRLARIVIDEAHCCSQLGHDFRPDYKKLSMLRSLFPECPLVALTATCPPHVLKDLLKILKMQPTTEGAAANEHGTVFFSSPLYRPNLRYQVLPKPASAQGVIEKMAEWILEHHPGKQGIVYTLSQKDTATVAEGLKKASKGKIKTGIYHAALPDDEKERIHHAWRSGEVTTVCATIAFGMGIDAPRVRYVLHHCLSKSLDGYYQESGRAGRDGAEADCVLFWRVQDASRLSGRMITETDGVSRLFRMVDYCLDLENCRKLAFEKYFSATSASANAFAADQGDATTLCGHCDNCARESSNVKKTDAGSIVWQVLKVAKEVHAKEGRVTLSQLADLCRGTGGTSFTVGGKGKGPAAKVTLDLATVAGGKVQLTKDDIERLLMKLALDGLLEEHYVSTAYSINVYLEPTAKSVRFTRLNRRQVDGGECPEFPMTFPARSGGKKASTTTRGARKGKAASKRSRPASPSEGSEAEQSDDFGQALDAIVESGDELDGSDRDGEGVWSKIAKGSQTLGGSGERLAAFGDGECGATSVRQSAADAAMRRAAARAPDPSRPGRWVGGEEGGPPAGRSKRARLAGVEVIEL